MIRTKMGGKVVVSKSKCVNGNKKRLCPYKRRVCFTDSSICGDIGNYMECPLTMEEQHGKERRRHDGSKKGEDK